MAGQMLQGITENMLQLGNQTRAQVEEMTSRQRTMNANMEATASQWLGMGSNSCMQGHSVWDGNSLSRVLSPGGQFADQITQSANLYDNTDLTAQHTMGAVTAAITATA